MLVVKTANDELWFRTRSQDIKNRTFPQAHESLIERTSERSGAREQTNEWCKRTEERVSNYSRFLIPNRMDWPRSAWFISFRKLSSSRNGSNGLSFGASMAKSLYLGLSSFNNFLRSMAEQQSKESQGTSQGRGRFVNNNIQVKEVIVLAMLASISASLFTGIACSYGYHW